MQKIIIISFLLGFSFQSLCQEIEFKDEIKPGKFSVGFKHKYLNDFSHSYQVSNNGREPFNPRPVMVNIWYPTESALINKASTLDKYFSFHNRKDSKSEPFFVKLKKDYIAGTALLIAGKEQKDFTANETNKLASFLSFKFIALQELPAIPDVKFPVIIFHQDTGATPAENSVMCEFLASHGFVVIGGCFHAATASSRATDANLRRSITDITAMLNILFKEQNLDWANVGFIGNGFGCEVAHDFLTSDGTAVDAAFFMNPYFKTKQKSIKPLFVISNESFSWSDNQVLVNTGNNEFTCFSSSTIITNYLSTKWTNQNMVNSIKNYHFMCGMAVVFFKAHLKKDLPCLKLLEEKKVPLGNSGMSWK